MNGTVTYKFDTTKQIFYKKYAGIITLDFLFKSWRNIIENNEIKAGTKRFLVDYIEAKIQFEAKKALDIGAFYMNYPAIFEDSKVALVMQKPEHVVFPMMMMEQQLINFEIQVFYTVEAAKAWLIS